MKSSTKFWFPVSVIVIALTILLTDSTFFGSGQPFAKARQYIYRALSSVTSSGGQPIDKVKKYIEDRFPNSEKTRAALIQFAEDFEIAMQAVATNTDVEATVIRASKSAICVNAIIHSDAGPEITRLYTEIMNSSERSKLGLNVDSLMYKYYVEMPDESARILECRFDSSKLEN